MKIKYSIKVIKIFMVVICVFTIACSTDKSEIIRKEILSGVVIVPNGKIPYKPQNGERYAVTNTQQLPDDMVVQGDKVQVSVDLSDIEGINKGNAKVEWAILKTCGNSKLVPDELDKAKAMFYVDGFGISIVEATVSSGNNSQKFTTEILCEFSTDIMLKHDFPNVKLPGYESEYLSNPLGSVVGHRENFMVKNKNTGRIVSFWWAKIKHPKSGALGARWTGLASMFSNDNGITWHSPQFIVLHDEWRTGWATGVWQETESNPNGEFLVATATHTHHKENQILQFRSTDNGESWSFEKDFSDEIKNMFEIKHLAGTYFGGNRTIATSKGTLVAPMVSNQFARIIWSDDNAKTWHNSNVDNTFPQGNEDALIETIGGEKLVFFSRSAGTKERTEKGCPYNRFESADGGKTWESMGQSVIPSAGVNLGFAMVDDIDSDWHGRALHTTSVRFLGRHNRNQLIISANNDISGISEDHWDTRLLQNYVTNYTDVLYVPEDKSILVIAETWYFGKPYSGKHEWGDTPIIRYFKFSPRYFNHLPKYNKDIVVNEINRIK